MPDHRKTVEEKKYAILTKDSIQTMGESVGLSEISEEVAANLSEDVSYRLREIIQTCCQFMRHSKRKRLTTEDFNRAVRNNNTPPVYGQNGTDQAHFRQVKEADCYVADERDINLVEVANHTFTPQLPGDVTVKASWLAVEGMYRGAAQPPVKPPDKVPKLVSEDLIVYYDNMTKAILGHDEELMKIALTDLRTNTKIIPVLPYFINFVNSGMKTVSHDIGQLTKLLHTVKSIINNRSLYLEPLAYLDGLLQCILYCILEPLAASINPLNDHWALRDYAANLLIHLINGWSSPLNGLYKRCSEALKQALYDAAKPLCSHYGAIVAILALGSQAISEILLPHISTYWPHLTSIMEDQTYTNCQVKTDAHRVHAVLLLACECVLKSKINEALAEQDEPPTITTKTELISITNTEPSTTTSQVPLLDAIKVEPGDSKTLEETGIFQSGVLLEPDRAQKTPISLNDLYAELYGYFGDSLATRLPQHQISNFYQPKSPKSPVHLTDPDTFKSGEELLSVFLKPGVKTEGSNHSPMEVGGDGSSTYSSDPQKLTVKSSLEQPDHGIKLTVGRPGKLKSGKRPESRRKRKQSHKTLMQEYFESSRMCKREAVFSFQFRGTVHKQKTLRSFSVSGETSEPPTPATKLTFPLFGKRKATKNGTARKKKIATACGNMLAIM
ncbi:unnamed protein product [Owenia fusiformis]|uniref:Histone H4 n=1 Tax=Owenia fusiformis TaxID=6347 RepID=A0A8S4PBP4_OWEFU|nr:unnamed protein product [Owenia fusiformis]